MKSRILYILLAALVVLLAGCRSEDQEAYFIPTPAPEIPDLTEEEDVPEDTTDDTGDQDEESDGAENEPVVIGQTTTKYVKLNTFGAILNVRSSPTTEENNVVGFLVHTEPVEVISIEDGWASFMYKGQICYVSAEFLVDFVPPYISPPTPSQ